MLKSFMLLWVSRVAESSSCQCLSLGLVFHMQVLKENICAWHFAQAAGWEAPTCRAQQCQPAHSACTDLFSATARLGGRLQEDAFHNSLFLQRAAFWLCAPCFTLSFGNLLLSCAPGVGLGKWSGGTAKQWNHLQLRAGKCIPLKVL